MLSFRISRNTIFGLAILLLLFVSPFPASAQWLNPTLDENTGKVTWDSYRNSNRYELTYWIGCRGPKNDLEAIGLNQFTVPGFDRNLHLAFRVKTSYTLNGKEYSFHEWVPKNSDNCWSPPGTHSLPAVGSGIPSGVREIETRFSGSNVQDRDVRVFIRFIPDVYVYEVAYSRCSGPWASTIFTNLSDNRHTFVPIPDYDSSIRFDIIVRGLKEQNGHYSNLPYVIAGRGTTNNGQTCDNSTAPVGPVGGTTDQGPTFHPSSPGSGTNGAVSVGGISPGTGLSPDTNVSGTLGWVDDGSMPPPMTPVALPAPV